MKYLILLFGLIILPVIASGLNTMKMDDSGLDVATTYHAESLYHFDAEWTNQNGDSNRLADFQGKPLKLVMFYGQCTRTCPMLIQRTWKLYSEIEKEIRDKVQVWPLVLIIITIHRKP